MLIGIAGRAGAGKDLAAKMIQNHLLKVHGVQSTRVAFADSLKMKAKYIGWNGKKDEKGRRLLQILGTEVCRDCIDPDYWIKEYEKIVKSKKEMYIFTPDVRFINELNYIRENEGYLIKIKRPLPFKTKVKNFIKGKHRSEQNLPDYLFDAIVLNDSSPYYLNHILFQITLGIYEKNRV